MADDLKRVGLIFKADGSTDFVKTLKEVNLEINKNYNEFKLVQGQWDKSTKSTQKLRAEQEYLKNAYEIQNDKVTVLRRQLEELENAENKNSTAIKRKRNELTSAEIKLESYNKKIKDIESQLHNTGKRIEEFGNKIQEKGKKVEGTGKKLSAFSAATLAALTASAKGAIEFESAFAGVEKTVDGTSEQMSELKQGIRDMAKEIPSSTTEISAVAEAAGQLGIKTENILSFSKAMIDLGNSTNLTAEEAASQLAKFANITEMSQKDFGKLGSAIVDLGNNFATTEEDIVNMAMRLAGAGHQVGLSEGQILGLATALSSVGIEAEMGGSAISKAMVKMQNAVELGGNKLNTVLEKTGMTLRDLELLAANDSKGFKEMCQSIGMTSTEVKQLITAGTNLEDFAKVSNMTVEEFKQAWEKDAAGALSAFIKGLGNAEEKGESAIAMLSEMGLTEVRLRDSLLRAANAGDLFNNAIETGTKAWKENTALTNEANKRYDTLESKMKIVLNKLKDMGITIGNKLMPSIEKVVERIGKWTDAFSKLDDKQVQTIVNIGLVVAAIGPLLTILGKITSTVGGVVSGIGTFVQAIGVMKGNVTTATTTVTQLASTLSTLASPIGTAVALFATAGAAVYAYDQKVLEGTKNAVKEREAIQGQVQARQELIESQKQQLSSNLIEIDKTQKLWNELKNITDENGNIKKLYKERAQFIVGELSKALGIEIGINGDVINKYRELQGEVDKTIQKKKAEYYLQAEEEKWKEALEGRKQGQQKLNELQEQYREALEQSKYAGDNFWKSWEAQGAKMKVQQLGQAMQEQNELLDIYSQDIAQYEQDYELMMTNTGDSIQQLISRNEQAYGLDTANLQANATTQIGILQNRVDNMKQRYDEELQNLSNYLISTTTTIESLTPEQVEKWKSLADTSYTTYFDAVSKMPPDLAQKIQEMTGVTAEKTPGLVNQTHSMAQQVLDQIEKRPEFKQEAINNLQGFLNGLEDGQLRQFLNAAGVTDADKVIQGIRSGNLAEDAGMQILSSLRNGLDNSRWQGTLFSVARGIASKLSGLLSIKANVNGSILNLPGHKSGLEFVPKDNYVARLHKGERVLTKEENKDYTEAEKQSKKHRVSKVAQKQKEETLYSKDIDYEKLFKTFLKALNSCKIRLDKDGFVKFIDDRLLEVM